MNEVRTIESQVDGDVGDAGDGGGDGGIDVVKIGDEILVAPGG